MIVVTLGIGFKWQIDPEASRFERYLGIASIVVGIGITLVLTRRLSEMYFRGCFRSKSYTKDEKLSMSQKIISTVVSFIYYITLNILFKHYWSENMNAMNYTPKINS